MSQLFFSASASSTSTGEVGSASKDPPRDRPVRDATDADHPWLLRHWRPHMARLSMIVDQSRVCATGPVSYTVGSTVIGVVDVLSCHEPSSVWIITTDEDTQTDVRIEFNKFMELPYLRDPATTLAAPTPTTPQTPVVTKTTTMSYSDGSHLNFHGFGFGNAW